MSKYLSCAIALLVPMFCAYAYAYADEAAVEVPRLGTEHAVEWSATGQAQRLPHLSPAD